MSNFSNEDGESEPLIQRNKNTIRLTDDINLIEYRSVI